MAAWCFFDDWLGAITDCPLVWANPLAANGSWLIKFSGLRAVQCFNPSALASSDWREEFTIIAPGTHAEALHSRVEIVRRAIADLAVRQGGRRLGAVSMSFGIATWTDAMALDGGNVIQAADAALYQAERDGRNRTVVELREAA